MNDSFEMLISVVFVVVILIIVHFANKKSVNKQKENLKLQATKRNGMVKTANFFGYPRLSIPWDMGDILVYSMPGGRNSPPHTYVTSDIQSVRNYKIKVCREHRVFGIGTVFGQDVKINNPDFDDAFVIQGSDEMIIREFLTHEIQKKILVLKSYDPVLEIRKNKLRFYISNIPKDEQQYDWLIDTGLALINRTREIG